MKVRFKLTSVIAILLILIISFCSVGASTPLSGDFDSSGTVDSYDAVYLLYNSLYGDVYYPVEQGTDVNGDGEYTSDDAIYLLNNILFGNDEYPLPDTTVPVTFNNNGVTNTYYLKPGEKLPTLQSYISADYDRYDFVGWYNKDFTVQYNAVPESKATLYAKFDGYVGYTFTGGNIYDPNNRGLIAAVNDPFGGEGRVLHSRLIKKNDSVYYGYYRGVVPTLHDGTSDSAFELKKGRTYSVKFKYRFAADCPQNAACDISVYAVDPNGVYVNGNKSQLDPVWITKSHLTNKSDWAECCFTVENTTDYSHLYIRFMGSSSTSVYDFYIDDLLILVLTPYEGITLVSDGVTTKTELSVGDALPQLETYYDDITSMSFEFDGWYDSALTTKYSNVVENVDTYYAKYHGFTKYSFETDGIYDPNGMYSQTSSGLKAWWYSVDPTGADNICLRAKLSNNDNNTHVALPVLEGVNGGYTLTKGKQYVVAFRYFVDTDQERAPSFSVRGCAKGNIGSSGGKTDTLQGTLLPSCGRWSRMWVKFTAPDTVETSPYLILLSQLTPKTDNLTVYLDDVCVMEFSNSDVFYFKTPADNITLNDNGVASSYNGSYIGEIIPEPEEYYGSEFRGWYNESFTTPFTTVHQNGASYWAKNDGSIINFENGGYFDPNLNFGTQNSKYRIVSDPLNYKNKVISVSLAGRTSNFHFAINESGYSTNGYKLTVGNTYEISFMYYAKNLNSKGVSVQFRGSRSENIGINGGKSKGYGEKTLDIENSWTGVTVKFTYNGTDLLDEEEPYLIMMSQDKAYSQGSAACTATVYFDDIVIKEYEPEKEYVQKTVSVGGMNLGVSGREYNIVIPSNNFSYLARMQCDELVKVLEKITTENCKFNIVYENDWVENTNQFNIFVGDVKGHNRDSKYIIDTQALGKDEYCFRFGVGNIYVNGGSTYALAMGISELLKTLDEAVADEPFAAGYTVSGKYSEKIDGYSTASYYRPTFLEDFDADEIDTSVWTVFDGNEIESVTEGKLSIRSAAHTNLVDGCLVFDAAFDDNYYYGGMLKSHGKLSYRYGYLETSCITPHGAGIWTAMWTTSNGGNTGLFRPEIDINESFGDAQYSYFNMHSWLTGAGIDQGLKKYALGDRKKPDRVAEAGAGKTFNDDFHTFGLFWTEDGTKFTVDGRVQYDHTYDINDKYYHDDIDAYYEKLCIIVSMTVGNPGHSGQFKLDESADYWYKTNKYIIDYVHIYQIDGQDIFYNLREPVEIDRTDLGERE